MLIGELSEKSGLSRDTIRYYEKVGLIKVTRTQRRHNNYKEYSEEILSRLLLIKRLKTFGFTLREIAHALNLMEGGFSLCKDTPDLLSNRIQLLEQQIAELTRFKNRLMEAERHCDGDCCEVLLNDMSKIQRQSVVPTAQRLNL